MLKLIRRLGRTPTFPVRLRFVCAGSLRLGAPQFKTQGGGGRNSGKVVRIRFPVRLARAKSLVRTSRPKHGDFGSCRNQCFDVCFVRIPVVPRYSVSSLYCSAQEPHSGVRGAKILCSVGKRRRPVFPCVSSAFRIFSVSSALHFVRNSFSCVSSASRPCCMFLHFARI